MVLGDLGNKIAKALSSLTSATVIDQKVFDELLKEICNALIQADVNVKLVMKLRADIKSHVDLDQIAAGVNRRKVIHRAVIDALCKLLDPAVEAYKPRKGKSNIILFVGLQGSGKTTTCTKLAYYYSKKGWKTALVCADTFRAGAFDQLKQNATKARIPFYGSYAETDPVLLAKEGVEKFKADRFEIIIVDTSGRHKQEIELFDEMKQIASATQPDTVIFVLDASIGQSATNQAQAFKEAINVGSIIITKMDGHAKGGGALSAVAATNSPIIFIGTGEHMDDLETFSVRPFVSKLLGMGDLSGLIETVQDLKLEERNRDLMKRLEQGESFVIRDLQQQFRSIQEMGPLHKIVGMLPGFSSEMLAGTEQETQQRMRRMMTIFESMTAYELDSEGKMFSSEKSRVVRVARGSGTTTAEVEMLLAQYKKFGQVTKQLGGKKGLFNMMDPKRPPNSQDMSRMQQQLSKNMDPRMLQQMGGLGGLQNMMRQLQSGGGLGGLGSMFGLGK
jgi:signal recognition particle subunit SRP54